jgi:hypothetical protein
MKFQENLNPKTMQIRPCDINPHDDYLLRKVVQSALEERIQGIDTDDGLVLDLLIQKTSEQGFGATAREILLVSLSKNERSWLPFSAQDFVNFKNQFRKENDKLELDGDYLDDLNHDFYEFILTKLLTETKVNGVVYWKVTNKFAELIIIKQIVNTAYINFN